MKLKVFSVSILILIIFSTLCYPVEFSYPRFRATDSNGKPLVGGKLYSYQAGSGVSIATYKNYDFSSNNSNPIILNNRGEAVIYLKDTIRYKFILTDSVGNQLWTMDNLGGELASIGSTSNVVQGTGAGSSITNGDYNLLEGNSSGSSLTSGSSNVFLGSNSGKLVTSGSNNIFIGPGSGSTLTSVNDRLIVGNGSSNIIVGDLSTKNLEILGGVTVNGTLAVLGTFTSGASVTGNQTITGSQYISNNQYIAGNSSVTGNLIVNGYSTIERPMVWTENMGASGTTSGEAFTSNSWNARKIYSTSFTDWSGVSKYTTISGVSVLVDWSDGRYKYILMPAGVYDADITVPFFTQGTTAGTYTQSVKLSVWSTTTTPGTDILYGESRQMYPNSAFNESGYLHIKGRFTLNTATNIAVYHYVNLVGSYYTNAGLPASLGDEIYTNVIIYKISDI